jgi:L-alanine-DL-glutamate epimerase-like enolase superfamily enzyme
MGTPTVVDMQVIPVAGRDSVALNLAGAHGPFFTRNIVLLKDSAGRTGLGEVPGSDGILQTLERARPLVVGRKIGLYNAILNEIRRMVTRTHQVSSEAEAAILRQPHEINLRIDNVITAVEAVLLDLLGGERLTKEPLQIIGGVAHVPQHPGLGIEIDMEQLTKSHELYKKVGSAARDDARGMQYINPGWKYDPKRPSLVRDKAC